MLSALISIKDILTLLVCRRWPSGTVEEAWSANIYLELFSLFVCVSFFVVALFHFVCLCVYC